MRYAFYTLIFTAIIAGFFLAFDPHIGGVERHNALTPNQRATLAQLPHF